MAYLFRLVLVTRSVGAMRVAGLALLFGRQPVMTKSCDNYWHAPVWWASGSADGRQACAPRASCWRVAAQLSVVAAGSCKSIWCTAFHRRDRHKLSSFKHVLGKRNFFHCRARRLHDAARSREVLMVARARRRWLISVIVLRLTYLHDYLSASTKENTCDCTATPESLRRHSPTLSCLVFN